MIKLFTILAVLTFGLAALTQADTHVYFAGTNTPQPQHLTRSVKPSNYSAHKKS